MHRVHWSVLCGWPCGCSEGGWWREGSQLGGKKACRGDGLPHPLTPTCARAHHPPGDKFEELAEDDGSDDGGDAAGEGGPDMDAEGGEGEEEEADK